MVNDLPDDAKKWIFKALRMSANVREDNCHLCYKLAYKTVYQFGIAYLFFYVIFKTFIPAELAEEYLAGAVLLGGCTLHGYGIRVELSH